jgi:outer membrane protein OmpA-like peptidoglycan-associated protein
MHGRRKREVIFAASSEDRQLFSRFSFFYVKNINGILFLNFYLRPFLKKSYCQDNRWRVMNRAIESRRWAFIYASKETMIPIRRRSALRRGMFIPMVAGFLLLSGCYMLKASEEYYKIKVEGKAVLFVLDTSGSMEGKDEGSVKDEIMQKAADEAGDTVGGVIGGTLGGLVGKQIKKEATKLGKAKRELIPAVKGLGPDVQFTILTFGGQVSPWKSTLVDASGTNKNLATFFLQKLSAGGGTPASKALEQAFQFTTIDTIFFLSDGRPTDAGADTILKEVRKWNADDAVVVNTIGLGDDQDQDFLCQLASQNNGVYIRETVVECQAEPKTTSASNSAALSDIIAKEYADSQGKKVYLSHGDRSFADAVVSFEPGNPMVQNEFADPKRALGAPDYQSQGQPGAVSLGCAGTLVVQFTDNTLVDIKGADLHIFEVEGAEAMQLAMSKDGKKWIDLGEISGGNASVDIAGLAAPGETFYFVKIMDLQSDCSGQRPGADVDAVAALGSAEKISIKSSVLFDYDKFDLKPEAQIELERVAAIITRYPTARILISGHTSSEGSTAYNQDLSEKRAASVQAFLSTRIGTLRYTNEAHGSGESRPIASNQTEEGRERNRRVEILILPAIP